MDNVAIDLIYESAILPERWPEALGRVCSEARCWGSALIMLDPSKRARFVPSETYKLVVAHAGRFQQNFENPRPGRHLARDHHGFLADLDLCTPDELAVDPIYQEVMRPLGLGWSAGTTIPLPSGDLLIFDFLRSASSPAFEASTLQLLDRYRPHLARSALMTVKCAVEKARVAVNTLEHVGAHAAVISGAGRVIAANRLFERLSPRLVIGAREQLYIADRRANEFFRSSIERMSLKDANSPGTIPIPASDDIPPIVLHLIPLRRSALDLFTGAAALVVATKLSSSPALPSQALSILFDLSPSEARTAKAISEGKSLRQIAAEQSISVETIRGYLKAVFAKTAVRRQSELVRLLAGKSLAR